MLSSGSEQSDSLVDIAIHICISIYANSVLFCRNEINGCKLNVKFNVCVCVCMESRVLYPHTSPTSFILGRPHEICDASIFKKQKPTEQSPSVSYRHLPLPLPLPPPACSHTRHSLASLCLTSIAFDSLALTVLRWFIYKLHNTKNQSACHLRPIHFICLYVVKVLKN